METPVWVGLIAGAAALMGALGSQTVAAMAGLKARRLDLFFQAKLQSYEALLGQMGEFAADPKDLTKYLVFLTAYERALLLASDEVAEQLAGRTGISVNAQRLRMAQTEDDRRRIAVTTWYEATKAASTAMRQDLKRLSAGLQ